MPEKFVFETERLIIRRAEPCEADIDLYFRLWNNPQVMRFVGYPQGLGLSREALREIIANQPESDLECKLLVQRKSDGALTGECKLGQPDPEGIAETDVKLLPEFWGHGYGVEIKRGLLDYLFTHTSCQVVQATPNVQNLASIRMQEAVSGRRVGEYHFHGSPEPVHAYIYHVNRDDWLLGMGEPDQRGETGVRCI
ncbi:MAG: N-acetyltransferase [Chloroflexota bacterium]|nr:MAG: N-acetyltransferase [Chloroflexota bacterium]